MRIGVETGPEQAGAMTPRRLNFDGREVEITEVLDEWPGADFRYFKVRDADANTYILRLDEIRDEWELTMFQAAAADRHPTTGLL